MTKPHTTLSEAVRALELPQAAGLADFHVSAILDCRIEEPCYTEFQVRALIATIAALIEQHEAQEPVYQMRHRSSQSVWTDFSEQAYKAWLDGGGSPDRVRVVYTQPTLAATMVGENSHIPPRANKVGNDTYAWQGEEESMQSLIDAVQPLQVAATQAGDAWQPIETAPKNGSEVLLWLPTPYNRMEKVRWFDLWENWQLGDFPDDSDEYCGIGSAVPTHWMPLPPAPTTTRSE